jgi:hypothetical protein
MAEEKCSIFRLQGVVMLYKTGPNKARFHFYSSKPWDSKKSKEFDLPLRQWVTVQAVLDRYQGYEVRTFDLHGREMFREVADVQMEEQDPAKKLYLFNQFKGYAEHFVIFKERKELPYRVPQEGYQTTREQDNALVSYKFENFEIVYGVR